MLYVFSNELNSSIKRSIKSKSRLEDLLLNTVSPITTYTDRIGKEFALFSSFSYCSDEQINNGKCCDSSVMKHYVIDLATKVIQDKHTFAILRSDKLKRIVISSSGTKYPDQLLKEFVKAIGVPFGDPSKKMYVTKYFNKLFLQVKEILKPKLIDLQKNYPDYQYIFTGHSLGGAMANMLSLDSVLDGYVKRTETSPVMINYGAPRVGNFIFSSYTMLNVPIIFRIVRNGDPVSSVPPCGIIWCKNDLDMTSFTNDVRKFSGPNTPIDKVYWHIGGLILYSNEMNNFQNCGKTYSEKHPDKKCSIDFSLNVFNHVKYYDMYLQEKCSGNFIPKKKLT